MTKSSTTERDVVEEARRDYMEMDGENTTLVQMVLFMPVQLTPRSTGAAKLSRLSGKPKGNTLSRMGGESL